MKAPCNRQNWDRSTNETGIAFLHSWDQSTNARTGWDADRANMQLLRTRRHILCMLDTRILVLRCCQSVHQVEQKEKLAVGAICKARISKYLHARPNQVNFKQKTTSIVILELLIYPNVDPHRFTCNTEQRNLGRKKKRWLQISYESVFCRNCFIHLLTHSTLNLDQRYHMYAAQSRLRSRNGDQDIWQLETSPFKTRARSNFIRSWVVSKTKVTRLEIRFHCSQLLIFAFAPNPSTSFESPFCQHETSTRQPFEVLLWQLYVNYYLQIQNNIMRRSN